MLSKDALHITNYHHCYCPLFHTGKKNARDDEAGTLLRLELIYIYFNSVIHRALLTAMMVLTICTFRLITYTWKVSKYKQRELSSGAATSPGGHMQGSQTEPAVVGTEP